MTNNLLNRLVTFALNSDNKTLNKIGNKIFVAYHMEYNPRKLITEKYDHGFDDMSNILKEMQYLIRGKYAGNRNYLFARMEFLIDQGFRTCVKTNFVNNIKVKSRSRSSVKLTKRLRNAKGQFIARAKTPTRSK
jgi:predicted aspartyl protease